MRGKSREESDSRQNKVKPAKCVEMMLSEVESWDEDRLYDYALILVCTSPVYI